MALGIQAFNPLIDIESYNPNLSINNVITFFSKNGITITKNVIHNYINMEIIQKPQNDRFTYNHLRLIVIIEKFKTVFTLKIIKSFFDLQLQNITVENFYDLYLKYQIIIINNLNDNNYSNLEIKNNDFYLMLEIAIKYDYLVNKNK